MDLHKCLIEFDGTLESIMDLKEINDDGNYFINVVMEKSIVEQERIIKLYLINNNTHNETQIHKGDIILLQVDDEGRIITAEIVGKEANKCTCEFLDDDGRNITAEIVGKEANKCTCEFFKCDDPKEAKYDIGKPQLTLVPRKIIWDIAAVRKYGTAKYGDPDNWKQVEKERYRDAAYRHFMAYLDDPHGFDSESGLPHLWHLACNIAFLCEMEDFV